MKWAPASRSSTSVVIASSSLAVLAAWRILLWRARTRARKTVQRVKDYVKEDGPLIEVDDPDVRRRIVETATRRASKWISLSQAEATPMVEQVGGKSREKKPVLTLASDYVLKPLSTDDRGIREIAFYEAVEIVQSRSNQMYTQFLSGREDKNNSSALMNLLDTLAVALAMLVKDPQVQQSEDDLRHAWKAVKREVDSVHRLNNFVPRYFGILRLGGGGRIMSDSAPSEPHAPFGVTDDAYLMLQHLSESFVKPCIMDLKIGSRTFESDATDDKKEREITKYPQQKDFGFRITGMRVYDPSHPEADEFGGRFFGKEYGRSLHTRESLLEAFRIFFRTGNPNSENGDCRLRDRAITNVLIEIRALRAWFENENKSLQFIASSLLIIYDGDPDKGNGDVSMVRMIDFGRVRRVAGGDPGYRFGLRTLKHLLTHILEEETTTTS